MKGKESTVFKSPDTVRELNEYGVVYLDRDVVADRVITGLDPASAEAFGKAILEALKKV